jgi:radical SAM protein with 4Fe4S-binding SPASM domain
MKCKHCWFNEDWKSSNLKNDSLTFEEIKKLSESINKTLFLSITGGEAFMRDDIEEIVKLFTRTKKVFRYEIPTSGFMTSDIVEKTIRILEDNRDIPFRVDISLDGNEEIHDKIRNLKGSFKNAVNTITELNKLKKRFSYFDVGVITTISNYNQEIIEDISVIIENIHIDGEWMVNITRGNTRDSIANNVKYENYYKAQEIIKNRITKGTYKGHSGHATARWLSAKNSVRRNVIKSILENKYKGGGCSAGSIGGVIYPDGSVFPCELLNDSFGNLRDYDFNLKRLWNSDKADKIRSKIQDTYCQCTQECFLSSNFLIQPKLWYLTVCEKFKYYT